MKRIIQFKLKVFSRMILKKYRPRIIGITGSFGKTSAKEAVYSVLKNKFRARRNIKNYNNEIGLPLTIIGADSPGKNIAGWFSVFFKALKMLVFRDKDYPGILVLEMGVDKPGDMDYLAAIARPDIGIVTGVGTVHVEYFGTQEKLRQEKAKLVKKIVKDGFAVINYDNIQSRKMLKESKAKTISFGLGEKADLRAQEISFSFEGGKKNGDAHDLRGISFKLLYKGSAAPVLLKNVLSDASIYAALAAAGAGLALGMNLLEISEALWDLRSPKGRMNLLPGIKNTRIIDDSYNAEPASTHAALSVLKRIPAPCGAKKFAVLGDMLELGSYSEKAHFDTGRYVGKCGVNKLITVGERSRDIGRGAKDAGMKHGDIFHFARSEEAGRFIQERIKAGDIILVKSSQGIRTEKIVKEIMAEPWRASELLVRQEPQWFKN